jgi:hypothetical protein
LSPEIFYYNRLFAALFFGKSRELFSLTFSAGKVKLCSLIFKITWFTNNLTPVFILLSDAMYPAIENVRSTPPELAGTPKYFLAKSASSGHLA